MINIRLTPEKVQIIDNSVAEINTIMKSLPANKFFNDIDFVSIVDTIRGVYMSDGSMSTLLDFERVLDEADLYAFKNWLTGELVQGPVLGRYSAKCVFMWPYKLMPDPRGALRLINIGCKVAFAKSSIKVPVQVKDYEDFQPGTRFPKMHKKSVWFVEIEVPFELMDDIKEGSIDLADSTIDLSDLEDAYDEDLDQAAGDSDDTAQKEAAEQDSGQMTGTV